MLAGIPGWFCGISSHAQQYGVDWYKVAGGGGTSSNGQYVVSGTVGQPDAGSMSGGNYSVTGGFWAVTAVQTPGAPVLTVRRTGSGGVIISWPSGSTGFILQQNANTGTTNWSNFIGSTNDDGTNKSITIGSPSGNEFFRLAK